jgi:C4-dicarboxylate-specific signal transduction histidine kinase
MVTDEKTIGVFILGRTSVQPFTDKQIELATDFAAQAAIALEITRQERQYRDLQIELAHANRVATMGQLTASIAHEIRQPLASAALDGKSSLNWLARNAPEIEEAKQSVEHLLKEIDRAVKIVDRIHRQVKKSPPQMESVDINETVVDVIGLARAEILKNGVHLRTEMADCLPPIHGDRVQLQQVVLNLVINAIQAMNNVSGQRELRVTTDVIKSGESVYVAVRDSGPGPSAENVEGLFQPFYTTKPNGMGMGLSICRSIIEDHGGRLWAGRIDPQGALFQFTLPVARPVKS